MDDIPQHDSEDIPITKRVKKSFHSRRHSFIVRQIEQHMWLPNAHVEMIYHLCSLPPGISYASDHKSQPTASIEIATTLHNNTKISISAGSVYTGHNSFDCNTIDIVGILSSHYKPRQYPLLLFHATPGCRHEMHANLAQKTYDSFVFLQTTYVLIHSAGYPSNT